MLVFVHTQIITTLKDCSARMGEPIGVLEGFIALGNSGVIVLVVPALFLVLLADYPQKGGIDFFYQMRTSKKKWIMGQMLFAVEAAVFLAGFLVISSVVMLAGCGEWMDGWIQPCGHTLFFCIPGTDGRLYSSAPAGEPVPADDFGDSIFFCPGRMDAGKEKS